MSKKVLDRFEGLEDDMTGVGGDAPWSDGAPIDSNGDDTSGDAVTSETDDSTGLIGVEPVPEYVPLSNSAAAEAFHDGDEGPAFEGAVDADYADDPEFFGKLIKVLPKIASGAVSGAKKVASNTYVRKAVKTFLATQGLNLESGGVATDEGDPSLLEVVIGADDRVRINNTAAAPWNGICHLSITARNGQKFIGTGWLIAPRCVITAGHCVFIRSAGGWASHIDVSPGRNGTATPFGTVRSQRLSALPRWVSHNDRNFDCGCIILPRPARNSAGQTPFNFKYAAKSDSAIRARALNIAGYPGDKPATPPPSRGTTMWFHARLATALTPSVITYDIDTAGGQSGSSVWQLESGVRTVVGIHTNGSPLGNSATRITPAIKAQLDSWRAMGTP